MCGYFAAWHSFRYFLNRVKYRLLFALISGLLPGCQSKTKAPLAAATAETPGNEGDTTYIKAAKHPFMLADSARRAARLQLPPLRATDTLTPAAITLLLTHDLAPLWANWKQGAPPPSHRRLLRP